MSPLSFLPEIIDKPVSLSGSGGLERVHAFDRRSIAAINAALGAGRPLLVRGEPGVGKTQLAEAAAQMLQRAFIRHVVDSRTESRDLLFGFDAVMRLAEAQLCSTIKLQPNPAPSNPHPNANPNSNDLYEQQVRERLRIEKFVQPGPLWWAFNSTHAEQHLAQHLNGKHASQLNEGHNRARAPHGWVVLIDEIDKAESDVPNGLLEALGSGEFQPLGDSGRVKMSDPPPLIIITTNEERILPDPFVRRCVVLHLVLPDVTQQPEKFLQLLTDRAEAHFRQQASPEVYRKAAKILARDRATAITHQLQPKPGQAEYLDLLRAVIRQSEVSGKSPLDLLDIVANYIVRKPIDMQQTSESDA